MRRGGVLAELYGQRRLLQVLVARELKARYRGTLRGYLWSLLNPLLLLAVYTAVFTLVIPARVASPVPYPLFLFAGLLPWLFASGSLLDAAVVLHDNGPLLKKVMCPPEVFPAVTVLAHLVHHLLALPVLLAATAVAALAGAMTFPWTVVLLPVPIALGLVTVAGLVLAVAALGVHFRDLKDLLHNLLDLVFFLTPIIYTPELVPADLGWVLLALIGVLVFKAALIAGLSRLFGTRNDAAFRIGLDLAQIGEFSFVLLAQPGAAVLIPAEVLQPALAAMLLSMIIAPFLIEYSERIVRHTIGAEWLSRAMELHQIAVKSMAVENHVVICGYGRCGQNLARVLDQERIGYVALDLDPARIHDAAAAGDTVVYGDAGRREVLVAAGLMRSRALVITFHDSHAALRVLGVVHAVRPDLPVVVRTLDDTYIDLLEAAGASEVVAEVHAKVWHPSG